LYTSSVLTHTIIYTMLKPDNNKPFPLRLGELKPILQAQAAEQDRSLHNWIKKILKTHVEKSKKTKQTA
jgi:hypothetical protein